MHIGASVNQIKSQTGRLQGQSTAGQTWVDNTGNLQVGGVLPGNDPALKAGDSIHVTNHSPVVVSAASLATNDIVITATDKAGLDDNLMVPRGRGDSVDRGQCNPSTAGTILLWNPARRSPRPGL